MSKTVGEVLHRIQEDSNILYIVKGRHFIQKIWPTQLAENIQGVN